MSWAELLEARRRERLSADVRIGRSGQHPPRVEVGKHLIEISRFVLGFTKLTGKVNQTPKLAEFTLFGDRDRGAHHHLCERRVSTDFTRGQWDEVRQCVRSRARRTHTHRVNSSTRRSTASDHTARRADLQLTGSILSERVMNPAEQPTPNHDKRAKFPRNSREESRSTTRTT